MKTKILIYGNNAECNAAVNLLCVAPAFSERKLECFCADSHELLQRQLVDWEPNLIIVLADRSEGMEGVYLAKEIRPGIPVFWFSYDPGFGMHSHRLECEYFAVKPLTAEKIQKAFHRCSHVGVNIYGLCLSESN